MEEEWVTTWGCCQRERNSNRSELGVIRSGQAGWQWLRAFRSLTALWLVLALISRARLNPGKHTCTGTSKWPPSTPCKEVTPLPGTLNSRYLDRQWHIFLIVPKPILDEQRIHMWLQPCYCCFPEHSRHATGCLCYKAVCSAGSKASDKTL